MSETEDKKGGNLILQAQNPPNLPLEPGDIRIMAGRGAGHAPGGSIIFELPDGSEHFRLEPDGTVMVRGDKVTSDLAMYEAFKMWLRAAETDYGKSDD